MKKSIITLIIFAFFASCGKRNNNTEQPTDNTFDYGVVINGIRWATRNVDAPGTFAPYPESFGMFFQWNRKSGGRRGGNANNDRRGAIGDSWALDNDPCPPGWRVPTLEEIQSLFYAGFSEWTQLNGVNGRYVGIYPHRIFLPASGGGGVFGSYWSSTRGTLFGEGAGALNLWIYRSDVGVIHNFRQSRLSVRCVAK